MSQFVARDLAGERHCQVTGVRPTGRRYRDGSRIWVMRCDCGAEFERAASRFKKSKTCGCGMMANSGQFVAREWAGKTINDCTPLHPTADRDPSCGYVVWAVRCNLCNEAFTRPASAFARKTLSHSCRQWWVKYRAHTHRGRPPAPNNQSHINAIFGHYRTSARARGIPFRLSKDDIRQLVAQPCTYCGEPPTLRGTHYNLNGQFAWTGIDRFDAEGDYAPDNCRPCCTRCNLAKGAMRGADFLAWVAKVYHHLNAQ